MYDIMVEKMRIMTESQGGNFSFPCGTVDRSIDTLTTYYKETVKS